ncbi:uracil-DNA glycosylase [Halobacillus amylolyticus]|uniref:Uracil-DNA glycosylase n=1 Tax=Halobacillus amylolyticus TaxID=2932259 RepID=A0ABY4HF44_9BACI|nr:uracil-DNA glycosylase [Halobacillus amylolyticus]UOR12525.1 uracil-DNA glycosylase [Halobacillus amylolyticus]
MRIFQNDWEAILGDELNKPYYLQLRERLKQEYQSNKVFPHMNDIYAAFHETPYQDTKVVIIGQDPYHGENQAHGFSFSVKQGVTVPPSLRNIYKELENDLAITPPNHGNLLSWARQGVLLLNNVLTVRAHQAHSHKGMGWEPFTDRVIEALNEREKPVVFILWGNPAKQKAASVDRDKHEIIQSVHPSPLSAHRGFFGSRPFSRANSFLKSIGETPINWAIPDSTNQS